MWQVVVVDAQEAPDKRTTKQQAALVVVLQAKQDLAPHLPEPVVVEALKQQVVMAVLHGEVANRVLLVQLVPVETVVSLPQQRAAAAAAATLAVAAARTGYGR